MPLTALITDAISKVQSSTPQVSVVHLTAATLKEARTAVLVFTSPETILGETGRAWLLAPSVRENLASVFIDEFHIVKSWLVLLGLFMVKVKSFIMPPATK